jgi:hypothetical protein
MKSHEIFQRMSAVQAARIFTFLQTEQKDIYKAMIQGLANQRHLRPIFIERKPPSERHPWIQAALGRGISDVLASHLLQSWLLGANKQMLCDFLDSLGIAHGEDGTVDTIPASPPREEIARAVERLLARYPAEAVAVYLHAFRGMDAAADWPPLTEMLRERAELQLGGAPAG